MIHAREEILDFPDGRTVRTWWTAGTWCVELRAEHQILFLCGFDTRQEAITRAAA